MRNPSVSKYKAYRMLVAMVLLSAGIPAGAQWLEGYTHRFQVTVDESLVPGSDSLVGFPFLFSTTDPSLRSTSNGGFVYFPDGTDLCFAGRDSITVLDFEIQDYDPVTGSLVAWIRLPTLSALSDTRFYLYYGNAAGVPLSNEVDVWSNRFTAIWHLEDDPTGDEPQFKDATSFMNHGTKGGEITEDDMVDGKISGGIRFNGINAFATMPVAGFNTDSGTVALWIRLDSIPETGSDYFFAHRREDPISDRAYLRVWPEGEWGTGMGSTYDLARGDTLDTGTWHHLAISWNGSGVTGYLDGEKDFGPVPFTGLDTVREIYIMTWMPESEAAKGVLDELRVSSTDRDSAWIAASFAIQHEPESYYTLQSEFINDFPCMAIQLDVGDSCTFSTYTNLGAGDSGIPDPGCSVYAGGDIWFYVVVPPDSAVDIQTDTEAEAQFPGNNGWMYRAGMALYDGSCEALIPIGCYEDNGTIHPRMAGATLTGKNPGDTIWIRIWEHSNNDIGMLRICVSTPDEVQCPSVFNVSGGGPYCEGDTGAAVILSGSEPGLHYTLVLNDTIRLDTLAGTGGPLTWSPLQEDGTYRVLAEFTPDSCSVWMVDSAVVSAINLPAVFQVTGGGKYCQGEPDLSVMLSGSEPGVLYTLLLNDTIRLDTLSGTGDTLIWLPLPEAGLYRVEAMTPPAGCMVLMEDSASVAMNSFVPYQVLGGGGYCSGAPGVDISLAGSEPATLYTLVLSDTILLDTLAGTGEPLTWSAVRVPGTYKVIAHFPPDSCRVAMADSAMVVVYDLPRLSFNAISISCFEEDDGLISATISGGTAPYTLEWTGPAGFTSTEEVVTGLAPGTYSLSVTDSNQCVAPGPEISIAEPELLAASVDTISHLSIYEASDGSVDLSVTGGTVPYAFLWTGTDDYTSSEEDATGMTVGTYEVMVTDDHGCQDSVKMIVVSVQEDAGGVFIPEGFSPNGDGYNDRFVILGIEAFPENELVVFNKQGVEVYHRTSYNNDWDGTPESGGVMGGVLPEGTYFYVFRFGENMVKKGYLYINKE